MKHEFSRMLARRRKRRKGDTDELAARLAPLEELMPKDTAPAASGKSPGIATQQDGAIVVGNHRLTLPGEVLEVTKPKGILGLEPVVLIILVLMLAFILFIAWQVSQMPAPQ